MRSTPLLVVTAALAAAQPTPAQEAARPARAEAAAQHLVAEDARVRIEELRVRGESRRIVVQPKGAASAPAYEIIPADGARSLATQRDTARGAAGRSVWNLLSF